MPEPDLRALLSGMGPLAVAVSGGVDSLTLATLAHEALGPAAAMFHATSPAVPEDATARVLRMAAEFGWALEVIDAGEFADPNYRANPVDRCFFCKMNLYGAIRGRTDRLIVSGTNLDDLGEYRPGLEAARTEGVRHPFVEAGIDKNGVRTLAGALGLGEIAELPASPCLSSRVETGIAIESGTLTMIDQTERLLRHALSPRTIRCRVRRSGVVIELDQDALARIDPATEQDLRALVQDAVRASGRTYAVSFAPYRNGSAFLRSAS